MERETNGRRLILVAALFLLVPICEAQVPDERQHGAFIVELSLPAEFDRWYGQHHNDKTLPDSSWILADVFSKPNTESHAVGTIHVATRWNSQNGTSHYLDAALEFRPSGDPAPVSWIDPVGDWGYGILTATAAVSGPWILLPEAVFGEKAWVRVQSDNPGRALSGYVRSALNELITIDPDDNKASQSLRAGSYFVVSLDDSIATVRPELPSDMPCGGDVASDPPLDEIPEYFIPISALFGNGGLPLFGITYGKGC